MRYYIVDVFTSELFKGNPAGVCLLDKWINDATMQNIASENNLAETAFLVKNNDYYELRWFTPEVEMDLCGHATLASAFVIMNYVDLNCKLLNFKTASGELIVERFGEQYIMDFPSRKPVKCDIPINFEKALCAKVLEAHKSRDLLVLVENEDVIKNLSPNMELLKTIDDVFAFIVTSKGDNFDFVSRFFAPNAGIPEDPVTGSAHCTLIPFWSERLNKSNMSAFQLSKRGGMLSCEDCGERVKIGGSAVLYLKGEIAI
jgi:predicted PhzF superfamily epimerase YddE/YHI9